MIVALALSALLWTAPVGEALQTAPAASARTPSDQALAAFDPLIGTWRGVSITNADVVDEILFDRAAGGQAIRSVHSVNGGAYAGETLITFDAEKGRLVSFYVTNGGFHTTGDIEVRGPGAFLFNQVVHGLPDITAVRATTELVDGVYRIRSEHLIKGEWVMTGGFDYRRVP